MRRLALLVVALCVALPALASGWKSLVSPGHLGEAHADFAGDCDQCHLVYEGVPDAKCLDCHAAIAARIESGEGYHAGVADRACIECHTDHGGPEAALTEPGALEAFDHVHTGFALEGAHARLECATCHDRPLGEMQAVCIECHTDDDPHRSALGPDCQDCHVTTGWTEELFTLASHATAMDGGHGGLGCADCHHQGEHLAAEVRCNACHPEAHGGTTSPCDQCHQVAGWTPAEFAHGPCTCTFAGAHQTAPCLDCHPGFEFTDTPVRCTGCHADDLAHDPLGECSRCHEATSWGADTFDHDRQSAFPLTGRHLEVDCAGCHAEGGFAGEPVACEGCHAERGERAHGDFGPCGDCHDTEGAGFLPSSFDHASTGFPLTGRHADLGCRACHDEEPEADPR